MSKMNSVLNALGKAAFTALTIASESEEFKRIQKRRGELIVEMATLASQLETTRGYFEKRDLNDKERAVAKEFAFINARYEELSNKYS